MDGYRTHPSLTDVVRDLEALPTNRNCVLKDEVKRNIHDRLERICMFLRVRGTDLSRDDQQSMDDFFNPDFAHILIVARGASRVMVE